MVVKKNSTKRKTGNQKNKKDSLTRSKYKSRIENRQKKEKELLIKELKNIPIVTAVCKKIGVGQTTFYRWQEKDLEFKRKSEEAMKIGNLLINDLAKSILFGKIKNGEDRALFFWLIRRHPEFIDPKFIPSQSDSNKIEALSLERKEQIVKLVKQWKKMHRRITNQAPEQLP